MHVVDLRLVLVMHPVIGFVSNDRFAKIESLVWNFST
jgi:hypothetical protein